MSKGGGKRNTVCNEHPIEGICLKAGEDFTKTFRGKLFDQRPRWGNRKMCPRFHIKNVCFKDCVHKASHVPKDEVPP